MIDIEVANPLRILSAYLIVAAIRRPPPEQYIFVQSALIFILLVKDYYLTEAQVR